MKKVILFIILLFLVSMASYGARAAVMPGLLKPDMMSVRHGRLFVAQKATIFIYSLENFKLIKKFGKPGEGPQEFKLTPFFNKIIIEVTPHHILVNSVGKLSYFTLDGDFIKETRKPGSTYLQPLGEDFVGMSGTLVENKTRYLSVNLYDGEMKKIGEIYRQEHPIQVQKGGGIELLKEAFVYYVVGDKIFISGKKGFVIDIFDRQGKLLRTIKRDYELPPVTEAHRAEIHDILKRQYKELYEFYKNQIKIAPHFPAIASIFVRNQKVYVLTNREVNEKWELFTFDTDGTFLKKVPVTMRKRNLLEAFPTEIRDGKVYQLIENEETEEWELHVEEIE